MAAAQVSSLCTHFSANPSLSRTRLTKLPTTRLGSAFATGSTPLIQLRTGKHKLGCKTRSVSIRCEQSTKGNGVDTWLGRLAMVGFAVGISVEIVTGKGLLENFGLTSPMPTAALAVTGLIGVLAAVFIFQSASEN